MFTYIQNKRGLVSLATTLVIFTVGLTLALSVQYVGVGELVIGFRTQQSEQAFHAADSCVDEAMIRLKRNSSYTGASLSLGDASCTIVVTGSGGTRTVTSTGTAGRASRTIIASVSISGSTVSITAWSEDTT